MMPTVMVTFGQEAYALTTFVQIRYISAVTGPILTTLFGPNVSGVIIFVDQNILGPTFLRPRFFQIQNIFQTQILLGQKIYGPAI